MNAAEFGNYAIRKASGNAIIGGIGTSTPNQTFSGSINIVTATSLRLSVFGGGCGSGQTCTGYLTITTPTYNSYSQAGVAYNTFSKDIPLSPGTYTYYGSFSMASGASSCGNNVSIKLL